MNNKNPILNFRLAADEQEVGESLSYDPISGEHTTLGTMTQDKYASQNMRTMITLTREAADSTESAG